MQYFYFGVRMSKCVQSGFCCTVAPCQYGESSGNSPTCVFLTEPTEPYGQRFCSIYNIIDFLEKDSEYPMMASGCSSTLYNKDRSQVIRRMNNALQTDIKRR